jgi:hypothetical protein
MKSATIVITCINSSKTNRGTLEATKPLQLHPRMAMVDHKLEGFLLVSSKHFEPKSPRDGGHIVLLSQHLEVESKDNKDSWFK